MNIYNYNQRIVIRLHEVYSEFQDVVFLSKLKETDNFYKISNIGRRQTNLYIVRKNDKTSSFIVEYKDVFFVP